MTNNLRLCSKCNCLMHITEFIGDSIICFRCTNEEIVGYGLNKDKLIKSLEENDNFEEVNEQDEAIV